MAKLKNWSVAGQTWFHVWPNNFLRLNVCSNISQVIEIALIILDDQLPIITHRINCQNDRFSLLGFGILRKVSQMLLVVVGLIVIHNRLSKLSLTDLWLDLDQVAVGNPNRCQFLY